MREPVVGRLSLVVGQDELLMKTLAVEMRVQAKAKSGDHEDCESFRRRQADDQGPTTI
jgi:hypothetical protein